MHFYIINVVGSVIRYSYRVFSEILSDCCVLLMLLRQNKNSAISIAEMPRNVAQVNVC